MSFLQAAAVENDRKPKLPVPKKNRLPSSKQHRLTPPSTVCFVCGKDEVGEIVRCSRVHCAKIYHLACLTLEEKPQGEYCAVLYILLDKMSIHNGR